MPRKACTPLRVMPRTAPSEVWTVGVVAVTPADVSPPSDAHRGPPLRAARRTGQAPQVGRSGGRRARAPGRAGGRRARGGGGGGGRGGEHGLVEQVPPR